MWGCGFKELLPSTEHLFKLNRCFALFPSKQSLLFQGEWMIGSKVYLPCFHCGCNEHFIPNHLPANFWSFRSAQFYFLIMAFHDQQLWEFLGQQPSVDLKGCKHVMVFFLLQKHKSNQLYPIPTPLKFNSNSYHCVPFLKYANSKKLCKKWNT